MITYAQNREDVVLARVFIEPRGFYVDVGAASPELNSVTKAFYDRGWNGVNVEPLELWYRELVDERPRDVNLQVGLGDRPGELEFYDVGETAADESTFSAEVAEQLRSRGANPKRRLVPVTTLAQVCEEHAPDQIEFLKVDVEGWELQVLRGGDWSRFRPLVLVVESTYPGSSEAADDEIRRFLGDAGYLEGLFDGVNRFYVRGDRPDLLPPLSFPANAIDGFRDATLIKLQEAADAAAARAAELDRAASELVAARDSANARIGELESVAGRLRGEIDSLGISLRRAQEELQAARREANDASTQFHVTREALERRLAE